MIPAMNVHVVVPKEYFDYLHGQQREDAIKLFTSINEKKIKRDKRKTSNEILGSWLLSHLLRHLRVGDVNHNFQSLHGLATQIADVARSAYFSKMPTTVESIIEYCISIFERDTGGNLGFGLDGDGKINDLDTTRIAICALQSMKYEITSSALAHDDFINLWKSCNNKSSALCDIFGIHSEVQQLNKKFTWVLLCAYHLSERKGNKDGLGRRHRALSIAACISFLAGVIESSNKSSSPHTSLKRTRTDTSQEEDTLSRAQKCDRYKRARRAAMKNVLSSLYTEDVTGTDISNTNNISDASVQKTPDTAPDDRSELGIVTWAVSTMVPDLNIRSDEIEQETRKITTFVLQQIQLGKFDSSVLDTEEGRKDFMNYIKESTAEASGTDWMNEVNIFNTGMRPFLTDSRTLSPENNASALSVIDPYKCDQLIELNDWIETILVMSAHTVRPSRNLLKFLETPGDRMSSNKFSDGSCLEKIIVPLLNKSLDRFVEMIDEKEKAEEAKICLDELGVLQCQGNYLFGEQKGKLCAATITRAFVALYYHSLECILHHERMRLRTSSNKRLVMNQDFHKGVVCLSFMCLTHVISARRHAKDTRWKYDFAFDISQSTFYDFLKISGNFVRSMTSASTEYSHTLKLPEVLVKELQTAEQTLLQSQLWQDSAGEASKLFNIVNEIQQQGQWPPKILEENQSSEGGRSGDRQPKESSSMKKEQNFIECCMIKVLVTAGQTISSLCSELGIVTISSRILSVFRRLLREKIDIFRNHHIDTIILCITYAMCKCYDISPEKSFSDIIRGYKKTFGDSLSHCILKSVSLESNKKGNIMMFYNKFFLVRIVASLQDSDNRMDFTGSFGPNISVVIQKDGLLRGKSSLRKVQTFGSATKLTKT